MEKLVTLIHSLSKSEKRYFKLNAGLQKGEKNYLVLLDAILKQPVYDEAKLLKKFKGQAFIKNFGVAKSDLYKLLLKSLRQYHSQNSLTSQLADMLKDIEILYRKGLYEQCQIIIKKGIGMAEKANKFLFKSLFISWDRVLNQAHYYSLDEAAIEASWQGVDESLKLAANNNDYWKVSSLCFLYYRKYSLSGDKQSNTKLKKMEQHPLFRDKRNAQSFLAQQLFYNTQVFFSQVNGQLAESLIYAKRIVDLFEANPLILKDSLKSYIIVFHNYISVLIDLRQYDMAKNQIDKLVEIPQKYPKQKQRTINMLIFRYEIYLELTIANKSCQFDRIGTKITAFRENLEQFSADIGPFAIMKIYYQLSYMYFLMEQYNESQYCCYKILQSQGLDWSKESFHINLIYFLAHYELGNIDLQESIGRQLHRMLKTGNNFSDFENILSHFVRKLPLVYKEKELYKLYQNTYDALYQLPQEARNTITLDNFNILIWLKSKIENRGFAEMIQEDEERKVSTL